MWQPPCSHPRISAVLLVGGATERDASDRPRLSGGSTNTRWEETTESASLHIHIILQAAPESPKEQLGAFAEELTEGSIRPRSRVTGSPPPAPTDPQSKQFSGRWRNRPELPGLRMEQARTESPGVRRPVDQQPETPWTGEWSVLYTRIRQIAMWNVALLRVVLKFHNMAFRIKYYTRYFLNREGRP